jgi:hypothetical protein
LAIFAQKRSGLLAPSLRYSATVFLFQFACRVNSALGLKTRFSDVVLDANADASELCARALLILGDVEPGLYREHHARLQQAGLSADGVGAHVVGVEAEPVTGAVHVIGAVGILGDQLADVSLEQAEIDESLDQGAHGRVVNLLEGCTGPAGLERGVMGGEYDLVEGPRRALHRSVDRVGAGHVRGVAVELAGGVDEDELPAHELVFVGGVVESGRISPTSHDRGVGGSAGAESAEGVLEHRGDLVLEAPVPDQPRRFAVGLGRNRRRAPHDLDLGGFLAQTHLVEQVAGIRDGRGRLDALA